MDGIRVIDTSKEDRLGPRGQSKPVMVVWVETDKGASGRFEMPASDWNKENLEARLAQERDSLNLGFDL